MHDFDFADDVALLATSIVAVEKLLESAEEASNHVWLPLNANKTKAMLMNITYTTLEDTPVENGKDFKYL